MALAALLLVAGLVRNATAASDSCRAERSCREKSEQASQLATQRRYDEALALYESAYARVPEPRLLINIGRCHYRLGRARRALEFYENFQKLNIDVEAELRTRVEQYVAEAKQAIRSDSPPPPPTIEKAPAPVPTPVVVAPPTPAPPEPAPPPSSEGVKSGRPAWRIGVGAAALGVGGALVGLGGVALAADGKCVMPSPIMPERCFATTESNGSRSILLVDGKPMGIGLVVSGGALVIGGVVLLALPARRVQRVASLR